MKLKTRYLLKLTVIYMSMSLIVCCLCLIGLIWNNYYVVTSDLLGTVGAYINMFLLVYFADNIAPNPKTEKKGRPMLGVSTYFLRFVLMAIFFVLSFLVIYFTIGDKSNYYYLSILSCGVPYLCMTATLGVSENVRLTVEEKQKKIDEQKNENTVETSDKIETEKTQDSEQEEK